MSQHTVAGKIPEIKPGVGDLSHGWLRKKQSCSGVVQKVKISANKIEAVCLFVCSLGYGDR